MKLALCTYSHGVGNGIAHMDAALARAFAGTDIQLDTYYLRADLPKGQVERKGERFYELALHGAYEFLVEAFQGYDIVQVNGALDPVVCNAAAAAGVPALLEVMHQVECGGLHEAIDAVVCVSGKVKSAQSHPNSLVIYNGTDTDAFPFKPGRRHTDKIVVAQVSNAEKKLHYELEEVASRLAHPRVELLLAGSRPPVSGADAPSVTYLGVTRDMPSVYHQADLLFLIEKSAAFGLVFTEAAACGTLPIVSADSGAVELVSNGETGWIVEPACIDAAVRALGEAVETVETARFRTMQYRARGVCASRFSLDAMAANYRHLYEALGKRPRRTSRPAAVWMNLALSALLLARGRSGWQETMQDFLDDGRALEPYFMRHPVGQAVLSFMLERFSQEHDPALQELIFKLCRRLRESRCRSPLLDSLYARLNDYDA